VRYNVVIRPNANENKTIFDAAEEVVSSTPIGQSPSLVSFNGTVIAPVPTEQSSSPSVKLNVGGYTLNVIVYATDSNTPIEPERLQIPFQVTPEFTSLLPITIATTIGITGAVGASIIVVRRQSL
jgi:hypothetical protein